MQSAVAENAGAGVEEGMAMGTMASPYGVEQLSDTELIAGTRGLVARCNQHLARLLAHLAEVEARGIHRARACASLTTYCVYELRLSEDVAFRYARAARYAREFPVVLESLAAGELHLTGLLLLGRHLTEENHREVLKVAKHRSKREITRLVRQLDPLPAVPARIEPLGPVQAAVSGNNASWETYMHALNPVRELPPEHCPSTWLHVGEDSAAGTSAADTQTQTREPTELSGVQTREPVAVAPEATSSLRVQRYAVQFTACQEYVDLVERARDLLSHAVADRSLAEVHLRAMRLLVAELEKQKFGVSGEPRRRGVRGKNQAAVRVGSGVGSETPALGDEKRRSGETSRAETDRDEMSPGETSRAEIDANGSSPSNTKPDVIDSSALGANEDASEQPRSPAKIDTRKTPRRRQRREVYTRDGARCAFVSADRVRCRETSLLELHHVTPHARNGATTADNLALYCRAHNALAAEHDFGRAFMARRSGRDLPPPE